MLYRKSEKGQAIILIVFSIIGIIGLTALTVDGGMAYSDRRSAQGAADSAAWAGGLANARGLGQLAIVNAAEAIADQNGYIGDGTRSEVTVTVASLPVAPAPIILPDGTSIVNPCPDGASPNVEITVDIVSYVKTFFAPVIGVERVTNHVSAVTRACGTYQDGIFGGQAVFNLGYGANMSDCAFDSGQGGAEWDVVCSGIYSNTCAYAKNTNSVEFFDTSGNPDPDLCVSTVGAATGALAGKSCGSAPEVTYDLAYAQAMMPPNPCTGSVTGGVYAGGGLVLPNMPQNGYVKLSPDASGRSVYCVDDADELENTDVELDYVTLYFMEEDFDLKYAGTHGSIYGTPTESGTYSSYSVIVPLPSNPETSGNFCTTNNDHTGPEMDYRGNGNGILYGTWLAPSACVTMLGNAGSAQNPSGALTINGQIVSNMLYSNGTANITVDYCKDQHRQEPVPPTIILVK